MTGLAVDDAAWSSAWRRRSPTDKLLLCGGLVVCALALPAWPGSVLVGLTAVVLALGPARVAGGVAVAPALPPRERGGAGRDRGRRGGRMSHRPLTAEGVVAGCER